MTKKEILKFYELSKLMKTTFRFKETPQHCGKYTADQYREADLEEVLRFLSNPENNTYNFKYDSEGHGYSVRIQLTDVSPEGEILLKAFGYSPVEIVKESKIVIWNLFKNKEKK